MTERTPTASPSPFKIKPDGDNLLDSIGLSRLRDEEIPQYFQAVKSFIANLPDDLAEMVRNNPRHPLAKKLEELQRFEENYKRVDAYEESEAEKRKRFRQGRN